MTTPAQNQISVQNVFDNIFITNINGPSGIGIEFAPPEPTENQVSESSFTHISILNTKTAVLQRGDQTTNTRWRDMSLAYYTDYGMDFATGNIQTYNVTFNPGATSKADVRVRGHASEMPLWALFENNYHETDHGKAYLFEPSTNRAYPTTFLGTRVAWMQNGGNIIEYKQNGSLSFIGCSFDTSGQSNENGKVYIDVPAGGNVASITSLSNLWVSNASGGTRMEISPTSVSSLISNDDPTKLSSTPGWPGLPGGAAAHLFKSVGLLYQSGSQNWTEGGGTIPRFGQFLDTSISPYVLKLKSPTGDLAWWTQSGNLHLQQASAAIEFEGNAGGSATQLVAANPSAARTVTLPDKTGTVITSNGAASSTQMLCGVAAIDPGNITAQTTGVGSDAVTGLAAGDACACSPQGDWDPQFVMKNCYATANTLNIRLFNAKSSPFNAGSVNVDYCCTRR